MSLWDCLPPEMQEYVLKFAILKSPLTSLHDDIKRYYYNPKLDFKTWPMPCNESNKTVKRRMLETNMVEKRRNQFGCARYYRNIWRHNSETVVVRYVLDVTQMHLKKQYIYL